MSTVLVAEDDAPGRELLATLLGYAGHRVLLAEDGAQALQVARAEHPDLVIADVLMPIMDGFELVRQLRADPSLAATPVVFYTAAYHEREARTLAERCGVMHVLTKPTEPEVLLRTIGDALGARPTLVGPDLPADFERQHLRLVSDRLLRNAHELEALNLRLSALVKLGLRLSSEADPQQLLQMAAQTARELTGASSAVVELEGDATPTPDPQALRAPVVSPSHTYGWIVLHHEARGDAFSADDERLVAVLAAQLAIAYENAQRQAAIQDYAEAVRVRAEEFSALVENTPDLIARFDPELRHRYVSPAFERVTGRPAETFYGKTNRELGMPDPPLGAWELSLRRAFRTGREQNVELNLPTQLGERYYLARITPEFAADGSVRTVLGISRDITERRQSEAERTTLYRELVARERRLQELVSRMSVQHEHELQQLADTAQAESLTAREREILALLATGLTNREIGQRLNLSAGTVKNHVARLLPKLQATDRTHAAVRAVELGLTGSSAA
jgi:PAS domain S-box-containing protein